MAQLFKTATLGLTKQLVTASGDNLLYVNGNPVVAGVSGALNQTGLYLVSQIYATGQSAVVHANGIGSGLSGALSQSGSSILSVIANTGSQAWNAANNNGINLSGNLTQTGATLQGRLNALSGFVGQVSGGLETRIAQTGQDAILYASGASGALQGYINSVSGYVVAASGGLESRIVQTGTAAVNHANSIGQIISGNLTQTGVALGAQITALSGFTINIVSGGLQAQINATGSAAVVHANGIGSTISGNLTQTGVTLQGRINALSGFVGQVSGGLEVRITATGNAAIAHANSIGQTISGNLTATGASSVARDNSLSGWADQTFVHRTGQELISGRKIFVSGPVLTGIEFAGQSGSGIYASVQSDGAVSFAGPSGGLLSIDSGVNGSVFAVTNQYESPYLDIYEDGRVYIGNFLSNALFVSGSGVAFGVNYVPTGYNVLISGNAQYIGNVFSGTTGGQAINIADLFYPRLTNPSGYVTGATLVASGSVLYSMLIGLSGWTNQTFVHRTGAELISGQKQFLTSPVITGLQFAGISGSGLFVNAGTGGQIQFNSGENLVMSIDGAISGSLFAVVDESEFPILEVFSNTKVVAGQFLSNALVVSGSGVSFGTDYISPNRALLISGDAEIRGNLIITGSGVGGYYLSGQNLADILYPRSNPSGYVTGFSLYQTGSTLYNMLTGASGALVTRGNIISGTLATGIALTGSGLYVMLTGASGALNTTIQSTGSQAWNAAQNNALNISGNITQTGAILNGRIGALSGYVDNVFVHRTGAELISGNKTFVNLLAITGLPAQIVLASSGATGYISSASNDVRLLASINGQTGTANASFKFFSNLGGPYMLLRGYTGSANVDEFNAKDLFIGYDTGVNVGDIAAVHENVGFRPLLLNRYGGNVGIGTADDIPAYNLDVRGTVRASGQGFFSGAANLADLFSALKVTGSSVINSPNLIGTGGVYLARNGTNEVAIGVNNTALSFLTGFAPGNQSYWIHFPVSFNTIPIVNAQIASTHSIYNHVLQEISKTGCKVLFSDTVTGTNEVTLNINAFESGSVNGYTSVNYTGVNGGQNLGDGTGLFVDFLGSDIRFRSIQVAGSNYLTVSNQTLYISGAATATVFESQKTISGNYTALETDKRIYCNNTSSITVTLPSALIASGLSIKVKLLNTGNVIVTGDSSTLIEDSVSYSIGGRYSAREFHAYGQTGSISLWYVW